VTCFTPTEARLLPVTWVAKRSIGRFRVATAPSGGHIIRIDPAFRGTSSTLRLLTMSVLRWVRQLAAKRRELKFAAYLQTLQDRGLVLGRNVSFQEGVFIDPSHCFLVSIGDDCVFAPNVRLVAHDASTKVVAGATRLGTIRIGARCFLGDSVIVLPGVSIGDDCIVGAGSVVSRDIPAGSVAAGNPARVLKSTSEYRERHRELRAAGRTFGAGYHIPGITEARRAEVLKALGNGPVYID
jgi:maltose O-acetyltransferase